MKPLTYRILCGCLFLAAAGPSMQVQAQCHRFVEASLGGYYVLAIASDGSLWAPGWNSYGQLGIGNKIEQNVAVQVGTDHDWKQARAGYNYSLAAKTNGTLWAWGNNESGQLGIGNKIDQSTPVQVGTGADWSLYGIDISHTSGLSAAFNSSDGSLWIWGGRGGGPYIAVPTEEPSHSRDWKEASLSGEYIIALKTDGSLWEFKYDEMPRQTGRRAGSITKDTDWKTIAVGDHVGGSSGFQLAIKDDGTLWSWGVNDFGQLGVGGFTRAAAPEQVGTDQDWEKVAASLHTSYALKKDGTLWGWGRNGGGQLGDDTFEDKTIPVQLSEAWGGGYKSIVTGIGHMLTFGFDGSLWGWVLGRLGTGNYVEFLFGRQYRDDRYISTVPPIPTQLYQYDFITGLGLPADEQRLRSTRFWHYFEKDCRLICGVLQTNNWGDGTRATGNSLKARVWVDNRVGYSVRRHHQITPAFNPGTTTGWVRLFFTQEDFDAFNAVATNTKKLPTGPNDYAGKANLRVEQRSGVSSDGSGSPGSYPGTAQTINPDDYYIRWDATKRWWEVWLQEMIFGGGYWIKTIENPLPVTFGRIAAYTRDGSLFVDWTAEKEINNHHYEIEAGRDGETFKKIGELASRAPNGNSGTAIEYQFQTPVTGLLLGAAGIAALALAIGAGPRRRLLPAAIVVLALLGTAACVKKSGEGLTIGSQKIWVRIAQVDKDGTKQYSRIVQVITGN